MHPSVTESDPSRILPQFLEILLLERIHPSTNCMASFQDSLRCLPIPCKPHRSPFNSILPTSPGSYPETLVRFTRIIKDPQDILDVADEERAAPCGYQPHTDRWIGGSIPISRSTLPSSSSSSSWHHISSLRSHSLPSFPFLNSVNNPRIQK